LQEEFGLYTIQSKYILLFPEDFTIILISVTDPYHFGKLDPDPDPHQSEKQHSDPDQNEKVEALEGHFGALYCPNLENS
jgi:hypothetical protein